MVTRLEVMIEVRANKWNLWLRDPDVWDLEKGHNSTPKRRASEAGIPHPLPGLLTKKSTHLNSTYRVEWKWKNRIFIYKNGAGIFLFYLRDPFLFDEKSKTAVAGALFAPAIFHFYERSKNWIFFFSSFCVRQHYDAVLIIYWYSVERPRGSVGCSSQPSRRDGSPMLMR